MKKRTFIDYLQDLFTDIADAVAEPVILVFNFLNDLPKFSLIEEFEILPEGTLLKGFITKSQTEKMEFEFRGEQRAENVELILNNQKLYFGPWDEATRTLVDTVSPGDRMMTIGSHRSKGDVDLFSYEKPKKQTVV
jgi:hypothetical protein